MKFEIVDKPAVQSNESALPSANYWQQQRLKREAEEKRYADYLASLKAGDKIEYVTRGYYKRPAKLKVVRRTATQIVCDEGHGQVARFRAKDGLRIGGDGFSKLPYPADKEALMLAAAVNVVDRFVSKWGRGSQPISNERLIEISMLIETAIEEQKAKEGGAA